MFSGFAWLCRSLSGQAFGQVEQLEEVYGGDAVVSGAEGSAGGEAGDVGGHDDGHGGERVAVLVRVDLLAQPFGGGRPVWGADDLDAHDPDSRDTR